MTHSQFLLLVRSWSHSSLGTGLKRARVPETPIPGRCRAWLDLTSSHARCQSTKSTHKQPNRTSTPVRPSELRLPPRSSTSSLNPAQAGDRGSPILWREHRRPESEPRSSWRERWPAFWFVIYLAITGHFITTYVVSRNGTEGPSMLPTINYKGDHILLSHLHAHGRWIKAGDVVSYQTPMSRSYTGIKRVIGMPGDFVWDSTPGIDAENGKLIQVPEGHCWLTGDNLSLSRDSRDFGMLPLYLIRGKVFARYLPWKYRGWLRNNVVNEDEVR